MENPRLRLKLDLQLFAQEKTEKATPKKRRDTRRKGQVARSMELPGAFILFFIFLSLFMFGGYFKDHLYSLFSLTLHEYLLIEVTKQNVIMLYGQYLLQGMLLIAPLFLISMVVAVFANFVQFGLLFTVEPLKMKLNKLNPIEGFKRIFSLRSLVEFLKSLLKLVIVGLVLYTTLMAERPVILNLANYPLETIFAYSANVVVMLGMKIGAILIILAIFDYMYQKYEYEKSIRMSKQDIKDEYKKTEGDPLIKSRIREKQRKMALQRMMQEVPKADVVITNPTHYAVALKYDKDTMESPMVIAKGQDYIALKIKEIAKEHDIVTMENKPLARALYDQVEIGQSIPEELFQAVAEVLAYVYRIKNKM